MIHLRWQLEKSSAWQPAECRADALVAAKDLTPLARSLHAITGVNEREQRSLNILHAGFTACFPLEDVIKDAGGLFKFAAGFLPRVRDLAHLKPSPKA